MMKKNPCIIAFGLAMTTTQMAQADDYLLSLCDSPKVTAVDYDIDTGLTLTIAMNGADKPDKVGVISDGDVLSVDDFATKWGLSDGGTLTLTEILNIFLTLLFMRLIKPKRIWMFR